MLKEYVTIEMVGGMGNQLSQIAFAIEYSKKYNKELIFIDNDISASITPSHGYTIWKTLLDNHFKLLSSEEYNNINFKQINESDINNESTNGNIKLNGFFFELNYKSEYSKNYIYNIMLKTNIYKLAFDYYNNLKKKYKDENDNNYCFMHIRRGDYIMFGHNTNIEYVINSYNYINNLNNNIKIFIFSNDIEWCKNNLNANNLFYIDDINDCYIEFLLMTLFKNAIIDRSTFSWWAAYVGNAINIIAPRIWTNDVSNYDLHYPKKWIII